MLCNNNAEQNPNDYQTCTLDYCKEQAISQDYKYFTYASNNGWCIMCYANEDGSLMDEGDTNSAYALFECTCNFFEH